MQDRTMTSTPGNLCCLNQTSSFCFGVAKHSMLIFKRDLWQDCFNDQIRNVVVPDTTPGSVWAHRFSQIDRSHSNLNWKTLRYGPGMESQILKAVPTASMCMLEGSCFLTPFLVDLELLSSMNITYNQTVKTRWPLAGATWCYAEN